MKNKTKTFDCVEMKRQGAQRLYENTKDMNSEEELAYWQEQSRRLRDEQKQLVASLDQEHLVEKNNTGDASTPCTN